MASQLAGLRAQRTVPRGLIRHGAAIPIPSAIAADLPADGRGRSAELGCDRPQRTARDKPLDISSRSISLSARPDRLRSAGRMPPEGDRTEKIEEDSRSKPRPIELIDYPRCHRSKISERCAAIGR